MLTERQSKWLASVRAGIERDTGRSTAEWAEIARSCPATGTRARLAWMKAEHGLAQNRASVILEEAFPPPAESSGPEAIAAILWGDPAAWAVFATLRATIEALPQVLVGQRKGYTAFSRAVQFAAARPKRSSLVLGLALPPERSPLLSPRGRASWSDRLLSEVVLESSQAITPELVGLIDEARLAS